MHWTNILATDHSCTIKYFWNILQKLVAHIFTLLLAHFAFKLVNYSNHSKILNFQKFKIDLICLQKQHFYRFQAFFKDSLRIQKLTNLNVCSELDSLFATSCRSPIGYCVVEMSLILYILPALFSGCQKRTRNAASNTRRTAQKRGRSTNFSSKERTNGRSREVATCH